MERLRSALDAVALGVVAQVAASGAAAEEGWASAKDFVTAVTGGCKGEGRRLLALGQALRGEREATGAALAAGRISRAQAEVIVAAVDRLPVNPGLRAAAEALLLEEAGTRDATDLRLVARHVVDRLDPQGSDRRDERALEREERAAHAGRFLSVTEDGIGGVTLTGRGTVEDAAHLEAVLFPLAAPEPPTDPGSCGGTPGSARSCGSTDCAHDGRDPRGATALHNLVLLCRRHHTMLHATPWQVRLHPTDQSPEFLPPARLDPERRPRRRQPLRQ
ncbi:MAG TPA: DUF222 domain-containing protein [Nocardioidaceae bacterium]|nr:DUF222 domain-containing protein [Nocardioidaceae bacterium]